MRGGSTLLIGAALAACGGGSDGDADTDAAVVFDDAGAGVGAEAPSIPWLEDGLPPIGLAGACPDGWREVTDESGVTTCEPWGEGGALDCPMGQAQYPGEATCTQVGPPCPADGRVADLPTDRTVIHVAVGAMAGDGTRAAPYGSLTAFSFGSLRSGTVVAVDRGRYENVVRLRNGVALWGACVQDTVLSPSEASMFEGAVAIVGVDTEVRGVRIADVPRLGVFADGMGRSVRLDGVWVEGAELRGVAVHNGASLEATDLVVRGTRPPATGTILGRGVGALWGSSADITRAVIEDNTEGGVIVDHDETTLRLADVVVRDTRSEQGSRAFGSGIAVQGSEAEGAATATIERVAIERNRTSGIHVDHGSATVSDAVVRDTISREVDGWQGRGLSLQFGARVQATRLTVERNRDLGVALSGEAAELSLMDSVVRDTDGRAADGQNGRGLAVQFGAVAEIERVLLERNRDLGVFIAGEASMATLTDVVVRDTLPETAAPSTGWGVATQFGIQALLERTVVEKSHETGVFATGFGVVDGVTYDSDVALRLVDVVVRNTRSREADGIGGLGVALQDGVVIDGERVVVEHNRYIGFSMVGMPDQPVSADFVDVRFSDTTEQECTSSTCPDQRAAHGIAVGLGTTGTLTGFELSRNVLCGALISRCGSLDLHDGLVVDNTIGICVDCEGYDESRLSDDVVYRRNETSIESRDFPVPRRLTPL